MAFIVSNDGSTLKKYQPEEDETSALEVVVPGCFAVIGKEAFYEAYNVHSVIIEEGVKKIGASAFCACGMKKITLPKSLEEIAYDAFGHCTKLEEVVLPDNLKKLGKSPSPFPLSPSRKRLLRSWIVFLVLLRRRSNS